MKTTILLLCSIILQFNLLAQDCTVEMASIKGTYTGDCKKGKAEGKGKSVGTDTYEGEFKSGQPHGKGKYTWANGNWFDGEWIKGQKSGKGSIGYKTPAGRDSVVTGFWKKDIYVGVNEKPYIIHSRALFISEVNIKLLNKAKEQVTVSLNSITGNRLTSLGSNTVNPKPEITKFDLIRGDFGLRLDTKEFTKNVYTFEDVKFPFRMAFTVNGSDIVEIELLENGRWSIDLNTSY